MEPIAHNTLLQTVFEAASNGIAVLQPVYDAKGKVTDLELLLLNQYALQWVNDADYKHKRYGDVFPVAKETGILEKFIEVAETGQANSFEGWYSGKHQYWFHFTVVKQNGLLVVTIEDATGRKQAETVLKDALETAEKQQRLYDSITNNTPDLVYVFGLD